MTVTKTIKASSKAAAIVNDYSIEYEERKAKAEALLLEYLKKASEQA